jgi:hypothetical protein
VNESISELSTSSGANHLFSDCRVFCGILDSVDRTGKWSFVRAVSLKCGHGYYVGSHVLVGMGLINVDLCLHLMKNYRGFIAWMRILVIVESI